MAKNNLKVGHLKTLFVLRSEWYLVYYRAIFTQATLKMSHPRKVAWEVAQQGVELFN